MMWMSRSLIRMVLMHILRRRPAAPTCEGCLALNPKHYPYTLKSKWALKRVNSSASKVLIVVGIQNTLDIIAQEEPFVLHMIMCLQCFFYANFLYLKNND